MIILLYLYLQTCVACISFAVVHGFAARQSQTAEKLSERQEMGPTVQPRNGPCKRSTISLPRQTEDVPGSKSLEESKGEYGPDTYTIH
jgi:hypothetical protein